jgi:hypothetical protein
MRVTLAYIAAAELVVRYDSQHKSLSIACNPGDRQRFAGPLLEGMRADFLPLALVPESRQWISTQALLDGPVSFDGVAVARVGAFILMRATVNGFTIKRLACARLELTEDVLQQRNDGVRDQLVQGASVAELLAALVLGRHRPPVAPRPQDDPQHGRGESRSGVLGDVTLEQILQAAAVNPGIARDLRVLLSGKLDEQFSCFATDLEAAVHKHY